ncbi:MAG: glycerol-3-phosphate 1-O-acyltransferase PlsY [FCB group bacterium]|nr:glycerol-3-phosphate 1-O-acyltransferase PlsY [FCB group bacterium]
MNASIILVSALAYLIGSIPTAWICGKIRKGREYDIRDHGSGNVGTTNVIRNLGWGAGIVTFLVDAMKGFAVVFWLPALITQTIDIENARVLLAAMSLIGHSFPVFINFRGGKGVATTAGIIFAFRWEIGLICLAAFVVALLLSRQSGVGSIAASFCFPLINMLYKFVLDIPIPSQMLWFSLAIPLFIVFTHRENISKIIRGINKKDF